MSSSSSSNNGAVQSFPDTRSLESALNSNDNMLIQWKSLQLAQPKNASLTEMEEWKRNCLHTKEKIATTLAKLARQADYERKLKEKNPSAPVKSAPNGRQTTGSRQQAVQQNRNFSQQRPPTSINLANQQKPQARMNRNSTASSSSMQMPTGMIMQPPVAMPSFPGMANNAMLDPAQSQMWYNSPSSMGLPTTSMPMMSNTGAMYSDNNNTSSNATMGFAPYMMPDASTMFPNPMDFQMGGAAASGMMMPPAQPFPMMPMVDGSNMFGMPGMMPMGLDMAGGGNVAGTTATSSAPTPSSMGMFGSGSNSNIVGGRPPSTQR